MKVYSNNVSGINNPSKLHSVINRVRRYDIILLQETKVTSQILPQLQLKWRHPAGVFIASEETRSRRGVITLFSPSLRVQHLDVIRDNLGQFLVNVALIEENLFMIINCYGDPDTDNASAATMDRLITKIDDIKHRFAISHTIAAGDFNFVLFNQDTNSGTRKPRAEARLSSIIDTNRLYDAAMLSSDFPIHTYFRYRNEQTSARYDRFYVSSNLVQGIKYQTLQRLNDHAPISIEVLKQKIGQKLWRFQDVLLEDETFISKMEETLRRTLSAYTNNTEEENTSVIQQYIEYNRNSSMEILTKVVTEVRKVAMRETKEFNIAIKARGKKAIEDLITARQQYNNSSNPTDELTTALEEAQMRLKLIQQSRAQKAALRNHINYALNGERTTAYHFAMARIGKSSRDIRKLIINSTDGAITLENEQIISHMTEKFTEIATPDPIAGTLTIQQFLGQELVASSRRCPEEDKESLTTPVSIKELRDIVKELKKQSSPGPLGISNTLLKFLFPHISHLLVQVGNDLLFGENDIEIPKWLYHRIVLFVLKPGKNVTDPDSYRGLSMLENIYKMYSKLVALRMATPLRYIQSPQQFGFTKNKGCLEASRSVIDAIRAANLEGLPMIVLSTDFYKAFDSIALDHVENCLKFYEFPDSLRLLLCV